MWRRGLQFLRFGEHAASPYQGRERNIDGLSSSNLSPNQPLPLTHHPERWLPHFALLSSAASQILSATQAWRSYRPPDHLTPLPACPFTTFLVRAAMTRNRQDDAREHGDPICNLCGREAASHRWVSGSRCRDGENRD